MLSILSLALLCSTLLLALSTIVKTPEGRCVQAPNKTIVIFRKSLYGSYKTPSSSTDCLTGPLAEITPIMRCLLRCWAVNKADNPKIPGCYKGVVFAQRRGGQEGQLRVWGCGWQEMGLSFSEWIQREATLEQLPVLWGQHHFNTWHEGAVDILSCRAGHRVVELKDAICMQIQFRDS